MTKVKPKEETLAFVCKKCGFVVRNPVVPLNISFMSGGKHCSTPEMKQMTSRELLRWKPTKMGRFICVQCEEGEMVVRKVGMKNEFPKKSP